MVSNSLMVLTHTNYRSAEMYSIREINASAREYGALTLKDLFHSVGAT